MWTSPRLQILIVMLVTLLSGAYAFAEAPSSAVPAKRSPDNVYYSVSNESWIPYWIVRPEGISGIFSDVMMHLNMQLNTSIQPIDPLPLKRAQYSFRKGDIQIECCVNPVWRSDKKDEAVSVWTDTVLESKEVLVFRKEHTFEFETLEDLTGRSIATILGYGYVGDEYFKRIDVSNNKSQLRMLALGRVDAAIVDLYEYKYLTKTYQDLKDTISKLELGPIINVSELKMRLHSSQAGLLDVINEEIKRMKANGDIARFSERYR